MTERDSLSDSFSDIESTVFMYRILDNGCYLYKALVDIDKKNISVYAPRKDVDGDDACDDDMKEELVNYTDLVFQSNYVNIFIGKSPIKQDSSMMTKCRYIGEYNQHYEGNTILIEIGDGESESESDLENEYIFIGGSIFGFKSIAKIDYYLSGVGYNETPLPYALDVNNNIYLLSYGMMIKLSENMFNKINSYASLNELILNPNNDDVKKSFLIDYVKFYKI